MLHLFLQTSAITADDWAGIYPQIVGIAKAFPLKLMRIEAYNGFERDKQDKDHLDLVVQEGQPDEHLDFYGDYMSWTAGTSICFYKEWSKHCAMALKNGNTHPERPISWYPPTPFKNDGSILHANGATTTYGYIDTRGALYKYALIAIGILLENRLPDRALLLAPEEEVSDIEAVTVWLEGCLDESFDLPIYFDKKRLLQTLAPHYDDPQHLVERFEHLYRKQYKRNMVFALEHIGYAPTFRFYAGVLSDCRFGTFGFSDVLAPWIAATQNLESTLQLIAESKRLLLERGDVEQADKYDLNDILNELLESFILWTPRQREALRHFYTNEQALETGDEDLWGIIRRMTGNRIDICPIVASTDELFEAFMYHDPKNGHVFRKTIDEWLEKNGDAFDRLLEKLSNEAQEPQAASAGDDDEPEEEHGEMSFNREAVLLQYPPHEHFLIQQAMQANPAYFQLEQSIDKLLQRIWTTTRESEHLDYVAAIRAESNADKKVLILRQLKEKRSLTTAGPDFERWLVDEKDPGVLLCLRLLMSLKIYDRGRAYARYRLLHDRALWEAWRPGGRYAV
jgi:hypothetical protein